MKATKLLALAVALTGALALCSCTSDEPGIDKNNVLFTLSDTDLNKFLSDSDDDNDYTQVHFDGGYAVLCHVQNKQGIIKSFVDCNVIYELPGCGGEYTLSVNYWDYPTFTVSLFNDFNTSMLGNKSYEDFLKAQTAITQQPDNEEIKVVYPDNTVELDIKKPGIESDILGCLVATEVTMNNGKKGITYKFPANYSGKARIFLVSVPSEITSFPFNDPAFETLHNAGFYFVQYAE